MRYGPGDRTVDRERERTVRKEARPLAPGTAIVDVGRSRKLAVETSGSPEGFPVFLLHGTPGSRVGPKPRGALLYRMGIQLICYDRPGYGLSTRHPERRVVDAADDIAAIADYLGLARFSVLGRSGGGPHALAVAASERLAGRVHRTGVMVSVTQPDIDDVDWLRGMTEFNQQAFLAARTDIPALLARLRQKVERAKIDPETILNELEMEMPDADQRVVRNISLRQQLRRSYAEALAQGADGWIDDVLALRHFDWGFKLRNVQGEVRIWHGGDDRFSPATHARLLASEIEGAVIDIEMGAAHFAAMIRAPAMISWLADARPASARPDPVFV